ncbi:MAG: peptidoglycan-binding protein [Desulfobulbaceae bacterium]|nr:peptidoglycan-binding protein [Desulfobulbaceae bacterium]
MPEYKVKQGDHLAKIAKNFGFSDYRTIWDHPQNAELKKKRENPHVLCPGDKVFIPVKEVKEESGATEQRHRFKWHGQQLKLRLRLLDFDNQPLADTDCTLHVEGKARELTTDGDGRIEETIPATAQDAVLIFKDPLVPFDLNTCIKIGHLDPVEEVSGQKERLSNLGYFYSRDDGREEERFNYAVQEFQCDHDLAIDGICTPVTQAKLKKVHGC